MEMKPVTSSNVKSVGYDKSTKQLTVEFNSGTYTYEGVTPSAYGKIMAHPSTGSAVREAVAGLTFRKH